jgi:hypothetical protein
MQKVYKTGDSPGPLPCFAGIVDDVICLVIRML